MKDPTLPESTKINASSSLLNNLGLVLFPSKFQVFSLSLHHINFWTHAWSIKYW
jgi:hypothetical protein